MRKVYTLLPHAMITTPSLFCTSAKYVLYISPFIASHAADFLCFESPSKPSSNPIKSDQIIPDRKLPFVHSVSSFSRSMFHSVYRFMVARAAARWPGPELAGRASVGWRQIPVFLGGQCEGIWFWGDGGGWGCGDGDGGGVGFGEKVSAYRLRGSCLRRRGCRTSISTGRRLRWLRRGSFGLGG